MISYNMLLEFHSFLLNLANYENEFKKHKDFSKPDDFVKKLIDKTYEDLSPVLKSDLKLLIKDTVLFSNSMVSPLIINRIKDYREFRLELQQMSAYDYIKLFILSECETESFDNTEEENIQEIESQLQKIDMGDTILESYKELKKYPEETMERMRNFLDRMYFEYFEKNELKIEAFLQENVKKHQELLKHDPERFYSEIVKISFEGLEKEDADYRFFLGYLNIGKLSFHRDQNKVYCYYTYQFEKILDPANMDKQHTDFFKSLSDETRLNMVRTLAKRSYYSKELADELGINKATVSYHMKMFSQFNMIDISFGENKRIYYKLNKKNLEEFFTRFMKTL